MHDRGSNMGNLFDVDRAKSKAISEIEQGEKEEELRVRQYVEIRQALREFYKALDKFCENPDYIDNVYGKTYVFGILDEGYTDVFYVASDGYVYSKHTESQMIPQESVGFFSKLFGPEKYVESKIECLKGCSLDRYVKWGPYVHSQQRFVPLPEYLQLVFDQKVKFRMQYGTNADYLNHKNLVP
jgi:hypothetical protein